MAATRYPYFARAGWLPFAVCAGLALFLVNSAGWLWSLPAWLGCALIVYLFRDPWREIPASPLAVVSPADGTVENVTELDDPHLNRQAIQVSIQMNSTGVYSTRSPVEGKVMETPRNSDADNDQPHGVWLHTDEGDDLVVVMHRGPLHNLPQCFVGIGERVGQGQRCGYIHMGGRVEIYLPANCRIQVERGSRVKAGSDVIAVLVHK
jgi:phosphatidylserine decarboxylase